MSNETTTEADGVGSKALLGLSPELLALFPKLCRPRKKHRCRLCAGSIEVGEPCCRWDWLVPGQGHGTSHAHPECYQVTLDGKWDEGDWECEQPGDIARPNAPHQATASE